MEDYFDDYDLIGELGRLARNWSLECPAAELRSGRPHVVHGYVRGVYFRGEVTARYEEHDFVRSYAAKREFPGHARFSARFSIPLDFELPPRTARERARVRAAWRPAVRQHHEGVARYGHCSIDNTGIAVDLKLSDSVKLDPNAFPRHLVGFVEEVERLRPSIPVAEVYEPYAASWQRAAERFGLSFLGAPLAVIGSVRGTQLTCYAERPRRGRPRVLLSATFSRSLEMGLDIRAMRLRDQVATWLGGQDIKTGDALFDRELRVTGDAADGTARVLGPEERDALVALAQHEDLRLDDRGFSVATARGLEGLERIDELLTSAARIASGVESHLVPGEGVFRRPG